tara:strand:- start:554 stop:3022 length:2469 start_codon:yes stop_codon:yes gene_type:complete
MINLPSNYSSELGQHIKEHYLFEFYNNLGNVGKRFSTHTTTVSSQSFIGSVTNIPSIRESIDLVKSTGSLSNVSISLALDSDSRALLLGTQTFLNREVRIYSQINDADNLSNCLLVFKGILRAVQQTENLVTCQISAQRPFENITIPTEESLQGNIVPIVFGNYQSQTFGTSFLGTTMQEESSICHPVPVDNIQSGKIFTLAPEQGSQQNTGFIHESEDKLFRKTGSENMSKCGGTLLNNETATSFTSKSGNTIFGRASQMNLRRGMTSSTGVSDIDFAGTTATLDESTVLSVNRTHTNQGNTKTYQFQIDNIGSVKGSPEAITLKLKFSNILIDIDNFTSYQVKLNVFWGSSDTAQITNYQTVSRIVQGDQLLSIADIDTHFVTNIVSNQNSITNDNDNTGGLPSKVIVSFVFNSSSNGPNTYDLDFDVEPQWLITTQLDETSSSQQDTNDIINRIKTLYSGQDGHSLSGSLITKPIEAHRYLCETFMGNTFTSGNRPDSYSDLRTYLLGNLHYYITKKEKIEDILKKLQHLGRFIMRYKNDGTFDYTSPGFLPTSTTASTIKPYLKNIGTLQTSGGSGINTTDSTFGVDYTGSDTLLNGDIIAIEATTGVYEYIKVFLTDVAIVGADVSFSNCERNLFPSTNAFSHDENDAVFKVIFPHSKLTDNDITNLQFMHLPLDKIVTRFKINYHKDPASTNKFLEIKELSDSTASTTYNIQAENVKEINNEIDVEGTLSTNYFNYYNHLQNGPKVKLSFDIVNPSFYGIEVGDYIKFDPSSNQSPFGLAAKGTTSTDNSFDRLYFIVTSTSRTLGKLSITAFEIL